MLKVSAIKRCTSNRAFQGHTGYTDIHILSIIFFHITFVTHTLTQSNLRLINPEKKESIKVRYYLNVSL